MVVALVNQMHQPVNGGPKQQTKDTKMLLTILKNWTKWKVNQQPLHPQQQHLLPPFVVRRATNHNPVDIPFENAWAAARCNIATRSANERIGEQEDISKNVSDDKIEKEERKKERRAAAVKIKNQNKIFDF